MKKIHWIISILIFIIICGTLCYADIKNPGVPSIAERWLGIKTFVNGLVVGDPNTATIDPNGLAKFKSCQVNGATVATLDANSCLPVANTYDLHTNLDANSIGLMVSKDGNSPLNINNKFKIDPNGITNNNGMKTQEFAGNVVDDGTISLPVGSGFLRVYSINEATYDVESGEFDIKQDGTVLYNHMTLNCDDADTDGYICVYDGGSNAVIKNRRGGDRTVKYTFKY